MFIKALKMLWDSESLKTIAEEHFVNTLFNWREECPKETVGICDDEFNSKGLALCSINITEDNRPLISPQQIIDATNQAYGNRVYAQGNTYIGVANNGMEIVMYLDASNKIISFFPTY